MLKKLKLTKAIWLVFFGMAMFFLSLLIEDPIYLRRIAGACLVIGSLWFIYPIYMGRKNNNGEVVLDEEAERNSEEEQ